ncbi:MAG: hypothetical protein Q4D39_05620, partial [Coriobacteriaceae bacterium]|nr:hypothetical protein [Coriobacteriaceae bacterium]
GEIKALAVNNPLLKRRVELANELQRNLVLQRRTATVREEIQAEVDGKLTAIEHLEAAREGLRMDAEFLETAMGAKPDMETRKRVRGLILRAISRNAFQPRETVLPGVRYRGFAIVMPDCMDPDSPYVWLERNARHKVDLEGTKELGVVPRLDHVLEGTCDRVADLDDRIDELYRSWQVLEAEVSEKAADLTPRIRELKAQLSRIDVELEVAKNEKRG